MADSIAIPKTTFHSRSNSFPSRSHPVTTSVENHLYRLKASEATSCSASTIFNNLGSLKDLHECVNELIHLPSFQRALFHKKSGSDKILEASLRLLDACATARDVLLNTRESIQELQSSLRRKRSEAALAHEVGAYLVSRSKINKLVSKSMKSLKTFEKQSSLPISDEDSDLAAIVNMLKEVQTFSFSVLKSLMSRVFRTKEVWKQSGWSLVSKFVQPKRVSFDKQVETNGHEIEKIDEALNALTIQKSCKEINIVAVGNVLKQLQTIECTIQELEEGLEPIFRCLLTTRVSLLNVINH